MIRIICTKCKNAYLQNKDGNLVCPSCEATFKEELENLLLGVQYYNEENYSASDDCLMKFIVKNGAEPLAVIYKAFCDARNFDEDTVSLEDMYKKILDAFIDVSAEDFPKFIAIANDEAEIIEKLLSESHVRLFAEADAEKIKKEVANILNIQNEAKAFRQKLVELVADFNESSARKISAKFSDCFYVEKEIAEEVGDVKYKKICDNIASHTVFTGILTNDIKNLEIYYRCIVMFFQKSHDKYKFLLAQAEKFTQLAQLLEEGQYNSLKSTGAIADKLKTVSYEFLQESYKEHFDEQIDMQNETVVVIEPETIEEPEVVEEPEVIEESEIAEEPEAVEEPQQSEENDSTEQAEVSTESVIETENPEVAEAEENTEEISEDTETEATIEEIPEVIDVEETQELDEHQETAEEPVEEAATVEETTEEITEAENPEIIEIEEIVEGTSESVQIEEMVSELPVEKDDSSEEIIVEEIIPEGADKQESRRKPQKKRSRKGLIIFILVIALSGILAGLKYGPEILNNYKYNQAIALVEQKNYSEAITIFRDLGDYSDCAEKLKECEYNNALELEKEEKFNEAKLAFEKLGDYGDSKTRAQACAYSEAKSALENNDFDTAAKLFADLGEYGDSKNMIKECSYKKAISLMESKDYEAAIEILTTIKKYSDSKEKIIEAKYMYITDNFDKENKKTVKYLNELTTANYRNCADLRKELLGSSEVISTDIKAFVNYGYSDLETSLTQLDNTRPIYFHVVVKDKALYGQTLTLKYTTAFGYSQREKVTITESDNVAVMSYPSTQHKNYTVDFELLDANGKKLAGQKISF